MVWSAGPHACPSKDPALHITVTAAENPLSRFPDVALAVPEKLLPRRPGPFHHALTTLPARITSYSSGASSSPDEPSAGDGHSRTARKSAGMWSQFVNWLTRCPTTTTETCPTVRVIPQEARGEDLGWNNQHTGSALRTPLS
ncbi:hypothetical protein ABZX85_47565 [Streptomyces sp. NPDC004539]|uniref:hypothetical protein n=1 Tax=Streptomyces sp. NPDC004539 TaxID=3154280 RepID=UPI0033A9DC04